MHCKVSLESLLQIDQRKSNYWLVWNQDCKLKNSVSDEGQEIGWGKKYRTPPPPWSWPNWNRRISFGGRLLVLQGFQGSPLTSDTGYDWLCWQWRKQWMMSWGHRGFSDKWWKRRLLGGCSNFEAGDAAAAEIIFRDSTFTKVES